MKKLLMAALAASTAFATPAFASDTASDSFEVSGHVLQTCAMENLDNILFEILPVNETPGEHALLLNSDSTAHNSEAYLSCNDTNHMTITFTGGSSPLLRSVSRDVTSADDAGEFKDTINYQLFVHNYRAPGDPVGNPACFSITFGGNCHNVTQPRGAIHRKIFFEAKVLSSENQDARPLADAYTDTVYVTVQTI